MADGTHRRLAGVLGAVTPLLCSTTGCLMVAMRHFRLCRLCVNAAAFRAWAVERPQVVPMRRWSDVDPFCVSVAEGRRA